MENSTFTRLAKFGRLIKMSLIYTIIGLLVAITIHEATHAWMALKLGDPTAKLNGRLSLNPLAHLDPIGSIMLVVAHFGWGKPVPVDWRNLKNPSTDNFLIAIAGPISNFVLAFILGFIFKVFPDVPILSDILKNVVLINVALGVFNLLPIPPLDGSKVWHLVLSDENFYVLEEMGPYLLIAVLVFSTFVFSGMFNFIFDIVQKLSTIFLGAGGL